MANVFIDIETGGLYPIVHRVVEFGEGVTKAEASRLIDGAKGKG